MSVAMGVGFLFDFDVFPFCSVVFFDQIFMPCKGLLLLLCFCVLETRSLYVILAVLELATQTMLALNSDSQRSFCFCLCLCLWKAGVKGMCHHAWFDQGLFDLSSE